MKKINIAFCFLLVSLMGLAQRTEPVKVEKNQTEVQKNQLEVKNNQPEVEKNQLEINLQKNQLEYEGYTIRLLPAMGGTYGYQILKGKQLVVHQSYNPFTMSSVGLSKKEDVYKLAKWQIGQLKEGSLMTPGRPELQSGNGRPMLQGGNGATTMQERDVKQSLQKNDVNSMSQGRDVSQTLPGRGVQPLSRGSSGKLPPGLAQRLQLQDSQGPSINQPLSRKVAEELQIEVVH